MRCPRGSMLKPNALEVRPTWSLQILLSLRVDIYIFFPGSANIYSCFVWKGEKKGLWRVCLPVGLVLCSLRARKSLTVRFHWCLVIFVIGPRARCQKTSKIPFNKTLFIHNSKKLTRRLRPEFTTWWLYYVRVASNTRFKYLYLQGVSNVLYSSLQCGKKTNEMGIRIN